MSVIMLLSQFPKSLLPYLLDFTPKLKINQVEYGRNLIVIKSHIVFINHKLPVNLTFIAMTDIYNLNQVIFNIKNKTPYIFGIISVDNSGISIRSSRFSFDCSDAIIELCEYAKKVTRTNFELKYIEQIHNIYLKYYPNFSINSYPQFCKAYYGYKKFDLKEYEIMCQTGEYRNYFPIYYCTREVPLLLFKKYDHNRVIVAVHWNILPDNYVLNNKLHLLKKLKNINNTQQAIVNTTQ